MYKYSPSTKGFYISAVHGNIPEDAVEITKEDHDELLAGQSEGFIIQSDEDGFPVLAEPPVMPPQVPQVVTMRQARLALLGAGLLPKIEAAIDLLPSPQKEAARIEWDYSSEVHRNKSFVQSLAAALKMSDDDLDDLFIVAAAL